jgi:hypothetical protein
MANGYYDENGNYVPGSFADQLDMPDSNIDTAGAAAQQATANKKKFEAATAMSRYNKQKGVAASAMAAYKRKGATAAQKAAATKARNAALADMKKQTAVRNAALAAQTAAQNKSYELSGQYDKLLTGANRDAYAALRSMFNQYGLGSLAGKIYEYAKQGYGADVISLLLQDTKEYKTRFAGNEVRAKAGLPVLSPAEYLATEQAYRQVLQDAGLPKGFYDSPTDFTNWISKDISPTEIKGRVDIAVAKTMGADSATKQALKQLYGVDDSYIVAWALDDKKALPLLQKQATAASYGAEALKRGLELNGQNLEDFVNAGLSLSQVSSGFQAVAEALPNIQAIASRYGETIGQSELEKDMIEGVSGEGQSKRKRLASQERALFSGFGGSTPAGLSTGYQPT